MILGLRVITAHVDFKHSVNDKANETDFLKRPFAITALRV